MLKMQRIVVHALVVFLCAMVSATWAAGPALTINSVTVTNQATKVITGTKEAKSHITASMQQDAGPLIGVWGSYGGPDNTVVFAFLDSTHYVLIQDGNSASDPSGQDGLEFGTYTWDQGSGAFTATPDFDTNGEWGFSHPKGPMTLSLSGDTLTGDDGSGTPYMFTKVAADPSNPAAGGWYGPFIDKATGKQGGVFLAFFADNHFVMGQAGHPVGDPTGQTGIEVGTYSWDQTTKVFTVSMSVDTNGEWGLSNPGVSTVLLSVLGDNATYISDDYYSIQRVGTTNPCAFSSTTTDASTSWSCTASGYPLNQPTVINFMATNAAGSSTSQSAVITSDTVAPTAVITGTPNSPIKAGTYVLSVSGTDVTAYKWRMQGGIWSKETALSKKISIKAKTTSTYTVEVIGRDAIGNWQTEPTTASWDVDTIVPDTLSSVGAPPISSYNIGSYLFESTKLNSTFECKIDKGVYAACTSPFTIPALSNGKHTLTVRAKDAAGNYDPKPLVYTWIVDNMPPVLTVNPVAATTSPTVVISGTKEKGSTVSIVSPDTVTCTGLSAVLASATKWSCTASGYTEDAVTDITFRATDAASNYTDKSVAISYGSAQYKHTQTDLAGNWTFNGIIAGDYPYLPGWYYGYMSVDATGVPTATAPVVDSAIGSQSYPEIPNFSVTTDGTVNLIPAYDMSGINYHGVLTRSNDVMVATDSMSPGSEYGVRGYNLQVNLKKSGATYTAADLAGTWNAHALSVDPNSSMDGWMRFILTVNGSGNATFSSTASSITGTTYPKTLILSISSDGTVTGNADTSPDLHGTMSADKKLMVITVSVEPEIFIVLTKSGGSFSQADLAGSWSLHALAAAAGSNMWLRTDATIDTTGNITFSNSMMSDGSTPQMDPGQLKLSSSGILTEVNNSTDLLHGVMTSNKEMIVLTMNNGDQSGKIPALWVGVRK